MRCGVLKAFSLADFVAGVLCIDITWYSAPVNSRQSRWVDERRGGACSPCPETCVFSQLASGGVLRKFAVRAHLLGVDHLMKCLDIPIS